MTYEHNPEESSDSKIHQPDNNDVVYQPGNSIFHNDTIKH